MNEPVVVVTDEQGNVAITLKVENVPPELTWQRVQADLVVWSACLAFLCLIWAGLQVRNLFRSGRGES